MKNTREPFEEELADRLRKYTEEPDGDMWTRISTGLPPSRDSGWIDWMHPLAGAIVVSLGFYLFQPRELQADRLAQHEASQSLTTQPLNPIGQSMTTTSEAAGKRGEQVSTSNRTHQPAGAVAFVQQPAPGQAEEISGETEHPVSEPETPAGPVQDNSNLQEPTPEILSAALTPADTIKKDDVQRRADTTKAKSNDRPLRRRRAYSAYIAVTPLLGYQRIEPNPADSKVIEGIAQVSAFSSQRFGFRLEMGLETALTKRFNAFGSVTYTQRSLTIDYTEKMYDSTTYTTLPTGEILAEPHFTYTPKALSYELRNLGLQIGFQYKLRPDKPAVLSTKAAMSSETMRPKKRMVHLLGAGLELQHSLIRSTSGDDFKAPDLYTFVNLYYRLQYPHEGKWRAFVQPGLNYSFYNNENTNNLFYVKPFAFGLSMGCSYSF